MSSVNTPRILGHEKAESVLVHAIKSGRIFPTWIFHGQFGVGKSSMAYRFAKRLLSNAEITSDSLNIPENDPVHKLVSLRTHPDLITLEQKDSVSIDETRNLLTKIWMKSSLSQWRVVILENASNLNKNIYNSLLKVLEEPPQVTVIILICTHLGTLPKTLLSRAAMLKFEPLEISTVTQVLQEMQIGNAENLAQLSGGSIGYALHLYQNNGIEIYDKLLQAFSSDSHSNILKYLVDNKTDFTIAKEGILRILQIYMDLLTGIEETNSKEREVLRPKIARVTNIDAEMEKLSEIVRMLCKCETMMLDKSAVLLYVFEKFFN
jgi:DNA polymerase-3 subunit delta'